MKPRILVVALIAALGAGCASTDKNRLAYQVAPVSTVKHGTLNATSYYQLARYYHGQKRYDMAEAAYRKSISLDGSQVEALNALGSLYAERGDLERSVQQFEKALAIAPDASHLHNNLGFAYVLLGHMEKAYTAIRKALAVDPSLERAWANLERIAKAQSDTRLAAAAKSRQTYALPTSLLARASAELAAPLAASSVTTPHVPPTTPTPDAGSVVQVQPVTMPSQPVLTVIDRHAGEVQVARRDEITVSAVTTSPTQATPPVSVADARSDAGTFVLVSTSREVVDLVEPVSMAGPDTVVVTQANPIVVEKPDPVVTASVEPVVLSKAAPPPVNVATPEPVVGTSLDRNAEPTPEFDFRQIKVEVTNANGTTGFAKLFSARLRKDHIPVSRITNYATFTLRKTLVEYQPGHLDAAKALLHRTQLDAQLSPAKEARINSDVRIVLGRDTVSGSARKAIPAKAP